MLGPLLTDRLHGEESALTQTPLGQQIIRPVAQLTPEPKLEPKKAAPAPTPAPAKLLAPNTPKLKP